jgi:hypothetical protein
MTENFIYKVVFHNQGQVYEVYAEEIYQSDLYGFIEVEGYRFNTRAGVVVDPAEEKLQAEFEGVQRSYIPMHCIIRIDEVETEGAARISEHKGDKIMPFPVPMTPHRNNHNPD